MHERLTRTSWILGEEALARLRECRAAVIGLGGVGSAAAEALARSGIGSLRLVDGDAVEITNLNRQLVSTVSQLGRPKALAMADRIRDIAPDCRLEVFPRYYRPGDEELLYGLDLLIDAIDSVRDKADLVSRAQGKGMLVLSAMGCGNKVDPFRLEAADLFETSVCPLCRTMRHELRPLGVNRLRVVYSKETPRRPYAPESAGSRPGSVAWVPPVAGMMLAGEAIRLWLEEKKP